MKKIGLFFLLVMMVSLAFASSTLMQNEKEYRAQLQAMIPKERILNVDQFKKIYDRVMLNQEHTYLLDVRSPSEFFAGHIPGTDHIEMGNLDVLPKWISDPQAKIVVFCRTHNRVTYAAHQLMQVGYQNVWLFDGGIVAWIQKGYPLANRLMGKFIVTEYHERFQGKDLDPYRIRVSHRG